MSTTKTIEIICRYFIKATLAVVYLIRNGKGVEYLVTLNANGTSGCVDAFSSEQCEGCKRGHDCYHKLQVMSIEGLRGTHCREHGSIAGFRFVAPVEERKERKAHAYQFEIPADTIAMRALASSLYKTTSAGKRDALCNLFSEMADAEGKIHIHNMTWFYDADLRNVFEVVEVVPENAPTMPTECPADVSSEEIVPLAEESLSAEEATLFEQVDNDEIVLADEVKVEQEWQEEPTKAQVIVRVRECASDLVSVCDGARADDDMGCNGVDAKFLHRMVRYELWRPEQVTKVAERLQKYNHTQLNGRVPTMAQVERAIAPQALKTTPQAPKFSNEQQRVNASLNGNRGFSFMR